MKLEIVRPVCARCGLVYRTPDNFFDGVWLPRRIAVECCGQRAVVQFYREV